VTPGAGLERVGILKDDDGEEISAPDNVGFAPDASALVLVDDYHIKISPVPAEDRLDPEAAGTPIVGTFTLSTLLPAESGLVDKSLEITVSRPAATQWNDFSFAVDEDGILADDEVNASANTNAGWSLTSSAEVSPASKDPGIYGTKSLSLELLPSSVARFVTVTVTPPTGVPAIDPRRFIQRGTDDKGLDVDSYVVFDKIEDLVEGKIPASGNVIKFVLRGNYDGNVIVKVKVKDAPTEAEVARGDAHLDGETWSVALSIPSTTTSRELTFEVEASSSNGRALFIPGTMLPSYTQDAPSN
jgi:hypothetical protein